MKPVLPSPFILFFILVAGTGLSAGCFSQDIRTDQPIDLSSGCPSRLKHHCQILDGQVIIDGLRMHGSGSRLTGLTISAPATDVILRDIQIAGFGTALRIEGANCATCSIRIENGSLSGQRYAIEILGSRTVINLKDVSLSTAGGGTLHYEEKPIEMGGTIQLVNTTFASDGTTAVEIRNSQLPSFTMDNVFISADKPSVWAAVNVAATPDAESYIDNLFFSGTLARYRLGLVGDIARKEFSSSVIECQETFLRIATLQDPIRMQVARDFVADGLAVSGCTQYNLSISESANVEIRNSYLQGGLACIELTAVETLLMQNFEVSSCHYGIRMASDNLGRVSARLENGKVLDIRYSGLEVKFDAVTISNLTFEHVGYEWPDPTAAYPDGNPADQYGAVVWRPPTQDPNPSVSFSMHDSGFTNVAPFALSNRGAHLANASQNWWDAADGPQWSVRTAMGPPVDIPSGSGSGVNGLVRYAPFLTQPP